ncbi:MAG TPA: DUF4124 domain-containing protein [Pseudomonadales bacterium]|nr:DUF4124 domain-containing protein [Pseudomonadales bacterium]
MSKAMMQKMTIVCCLLMSSFSMADVYKWVDENGKTRFSDKAPAEKPSENIENELKKTNVDEASKNLSTFVAPPAEKTVDEEMLKLKKRNNLEEKIGKRCRKMQEEINSIARGDFVVFFDKDGNEEKVLEKDRGKKLEEWKNGYRKLGCDTLYPLE